MFGCLLVSMCAPLKPSEQPNVIVFMTDDQGYGDLGRHGNPVVQTPNLDRLYDESVRFTNFHVDPTCSPTRSALMTGIYSHRAKVWHTIIGRNNLQKDLPTMADVFKSNGYRTGHFGKWHLGGEYPYSPIDRGFDQWVGQGNGGTGTADDYWGNDRVNDMYMRNGNWEPIDGYAPDVFFDEAMRFIREERDQPFFVYLATYVPHGPWTLPDQQWVDEYRDSVPLNTAYFFASINRVDQNLGRLRECLTEEGLSDNTIFVFLTDNGTSGGDKIFNAGMRGKKGSQYEGGHRVPCFVHWPGGGIGGGRDVDRLTAHIDLMPTLIDLCNLQQSANATFDGASLQPLLHDPETQWPERTLIVESQRILHPEKWRKSAVMTDRWRLVDGAELYDMTADSGQQNNIADNHAEVVTELRETYDRFWDSVSEGDDKYQRPILGAPKQPEVMLCSQDWMPAEGFTSPWNQGHVSNGSGLTGFWPVEVESDGAYSFEVRRWPREVEAAIIGIPKSTKAVDAYLNDEPISGTMYPGKITVIPATAVRLKVGSIIREADIEADDAAKNFTVDLKAGPAQVEAWLLDETGKELCGAYYVYVKKLD